MASDLTPIIIAIVGTGGVATAVVSFLKVRPEAGQIAVKAAEGAVVVQSSVIDDLREQLESQNARIEVLERDKTAALWEAAKLRAENDLLMQRVRHLEQEVASLNAQLMREARIKDMERRLSNEETRNTDIEDVAREMRLRADTSEKRADESERRADAAEEREKL